MPYPPVPGEEKERLASLHRYAILDTAPEAAFDRLAALAARLFDVPIALVSLLDKDRQWFKSCQGPSRAGFVTETSRKAAFCAYTILSREVFVVEDARLDPRFAGNPLVTGAPGLRFYAGAPLIAADGQALGSLCVLDFHPRTFTAAQQAALQDLAASVVSELDLRCSAAALAGSEHLYRQMFENSSQAMWVFDVETLRFLAVNDTAVAQYGYSYDEFLALTLADLRHPDDLAAMRHSLQSTAAGSRFVGLCRNCKKNGDLIWTDIVSHAIQFNGRAARLAVVTDVTERKKAEDALRRSEQRISLHIQQTPLAVLEVAADMTIMAWNPAAETTFGYRAQEALGKNVAHLLVPVEEQAHLEEVRQGLLTQSGGRRSTNHNRTKSGEIILCEWYNTPLVNESGQTVGCASLARNITEEHRVQEDLRISEARKAAILETSLDCVISIDERGRILEWNPAAEATFGYYQSEVLGEELANLIVPAALRTAHCRGIAHYLETGHGPVLNQRLEMPALRRDGTEFPVELTVTAVTIGTQRLFTAYLRDITAQKRLEAEREALLAQTEMLLSEALARADRDPLTGLLNHRVFHKRLKEEADAVHLPGSHFAVLLLNLDNFKFFNDAYGHQAGDDVLKQMTHALQSFCRKDDILARFGGDEFALLLPGADRAAALRRSEDLRAATALAGYCPPDYETPIPFNFSVGIACFPEDGSSRTSLLEAAGSSLRVAKSGGEHGSPILRLRRHLSQSVGGFTLLDALITSVDNKDRYTRRHSEDVLEYSVQIAEALGLDAKMQQTLKIAALLHDVGKIGVPDAVLRKPGKLTDDEFEAIKQHPMMGAIIVGAVAGFEDMLDAVRHHHERWDGGGYPFGLRGDETPLTARLMAVADAYSAMTTDRPYRKGMNPERALQILEDGAGTQWDPECIDAFLRTRSAACLLCTPLPESFSNVSTG